MSRSTMIPVIVFEPDGIEIPAGIVSLERFREWARSEDRMTIVTGRTCRRRG